MPQNSHFALMAHYNQRMNQRLYACAEKLAPEERARDRGAFFGSVLNTLNHIWVGDTLWLKRFALHPANSKSLDHVRNLPTPEKLDAVPFPYFDELSAARETMDAVIIDFIAEMPESAYDVALLYHDTSGQPRRKRFASLVQHFFNHQTHHRGQVTTLLSQQGLDMGVTDLLELIPDEQALS